MKSTLINMTAVLFGITLVGSAGVGVVNMITKAPIELAEASEADKLAVAVLPEHETLSAADTLITVNGNSVYVRTASKAGEVVGYAVAAPSLTRDGFNGKVTLMVGFRPDGAIYNIRVLKQNETPGLGTNMAVEGNKLYASFFDRATGTGKNPARMNLSVTKDGGEVDALTAATISSRAYVNAVATAYAAYEQAVKQAETVSGDTAATAADVQAAPAQKGGENE